MVGLCGNPPIKKKSIYKSQIFKGVEQQCNHGEFVFQIKQEDTKRGEIRSAECKIKKRERSKVGMVCHLWKYAENHRK